jgi:hypothetical protein
MASGEKMANTKGVGLSNSDISVVDHLPIHSKVEWLDPVTADGIRCENGKLFGKV